MSTYPKTKLNKINRIPARADYNKQTIFSVIDQTIICHVAFNQDNQTFLIPMVFCRVEEQIILHGAKASRLLKSLASGIRVTISFTTIQDLVMARSAFHHSVNYQSVVIFGEGKEITENNAKKKAMESLVEHICPGRWKDCRHPNKKEMNATSIVAIDIIHASSKQRSGPAIDDEEDYNLNHWAGLIGIDQKPVIQDDPRLKDGIKIPDYINNFTAKY